MRTSRLIYLLLLAFIAFPCHAQEPGEPTIESTLGFDQLKGKVKHVEMEMTNCIPLVRNDTTKECLYQKDILDLDKQGNYISFMRHKKDGTMLDSIIYEYDEKHQIIKENSYQINNPHTTKTYQYKYNDQGKSIECSVIQPKMNNKGYEQTTHQYKYDNQGKLYEYSAFDSFSTKEIIKYNEKGDITEIIDYRKSRIRKRKTLPPDTMRETFVNSYNKKGQLIEAAVFYHDTIKYKLKYKYDKWGNRTEVATYNKDGSFSYKVSYLYDKRGNRIRWINYDRGKIIYSKVCFKFDVHNNQIEEDDYNKNGFVYKTTTQYIYDQMGNWIKKILTEHDEGKTNTSSRIIEYY